MAICEIFLRMKWIKKTVNAFDNVFVQVYKNLTVLYVKDTFQKEWNIMKNKLIALIFMVLTFGQAWSKMSWFFLQLSEAADGFGLDGGEWII